MPAGPYIAPFGFIKDAFLEFGQGGTFQQGKVNRVLFFIIVQINGLADLDLA